MTASTTEGLKTALATRPAFDPSQVDMKRPQPVGTIRQLIESQKSELARALPKHMDADRLARIAFTTIRSNRDLANCTPESLLGGLMTCAQLGLEPGPLGHAYFVPFKNEVTFILGYKGMIELGLRSGKIVSLIAREVYANDEFTVEYGLGDALVHKPRLFGDRGAVIAYYAVAKLTGGGHAFVVMSRDDIEKSRKRSRAKDKGPWVSDYDAMAKKTCVRRLFTYLPTSIELVQAMNQDGQVRTAVTADAIDDAPSYRDGAIDGQVIETPDAGPVNTSSGEMQQPPGDVVDGAIVEDPDEPAWPDAAQPPA